MAKTMQNVVDQARIPLNDADKKRYPDTELLGYANGAVSTLKIKRPDLFFGQFLSMPGDKELVDSFPLDDTLFSPVCDYVTARAESKNDESVLEQRAMAYFALFREQI